MDKNEIAQILREMGILIELQDENPLKGLAYRRAASSLESVKNLDRTLKNKKLEELPGIGKKIAALIKILKNHGELTYYQNLKKKIPESLYELINLPGMSVQKVRTLFKEWNVQSLSDFQKLLHENHRLQGFSPSFLEKMRKRIARIKKEGVSLPWGQAMELATVLQNKLLQHNSTQIEISGELRRKNELIFSIDIVCCSPSPLLEAFSQHPIVKRVAKQTAKRVKVILKKGLFATLHMASDQDFPYVLLKTTGSKKHLDALKKQGRHSKTAKSEKAIYESLKLPFIPPELREDGTEVIAAKEGRLPSLIEFEDLQGTFHCHTTDSDGVDTLQAMAKQARKIGWKYLGISDHSKSLKIANGMSEEKLLRQVKRIRDLNKKFNGSFHLFSGVECDVLKEGNLDYEDAILKQLDFVIISIHRHFKMKRKEMTMRLIKAIENPYTTMVGHLTGRLLRYRDPYQLDVAKVIDACIANDKAIEINAYPSRMEMDWRYWRKAKEKGLKCCINPDAHSAPDLLDCHYGINVARKGWLEKEDVINTLPLHKMKAFLKK